MMEKKYSFSLLPIIRKNKKNRDSEVPVYLRITCDGRRVEISVKIFVDPGKWQAAKGRVKGSIEETKRLNQTLKPSNIG